MVAVSNPAPAISLFLGISLIPNHLRVRIRM